MALRLLWSCMRILFLVALAACVASTQLNAVEREPAPAQTKGELERMLAEVRQKQQTHDEIKDQTKQRLIELGTDLKKYREIADSQFGKDLAQPAWDAVLKKWGVPLGSVPCGDETALGRVVVPGYDPAPQHPVSPKQSIYSPSLPGVQAPEPERARLSDNYDPGVYYYKPEWDKHLPPLEREASKQSTMRWLRESANPELFAKGLDSIYEKRTQGNKSAQHGSSELTSTETASRDAGLPAKIVVLLLTGIVVTSLLVYLRRRW